MSLKMIACVTADTWGIGFHGQLLFKHPVDQLLFSFLTFDHPVIMGRKTLESLKRPLPHRRNIVLSSKKIQIAGCEVFHSQEELIHCITDSTDLDDAFVIGGGQIYEMLLPYCDTAYITKVICNLKEDSIDTYCPNLDHMYEWMIVVDRACPSVMFDNRDQMYRFQIYKRRCAMGGNHV